MRGPRDRPPPPRRRGASVDGVTRVARFVLTFALLLATISGTVGLFPGAAYELGVAMPQRRVSSGLDDFEGLDERMARAALDKVELSTRETASFMVAKSVTRVERCPGTPSGREFEEMLSDLGGFSAEIRPYTIFGIPQPEIVIACEEGAQCGLQ